MHSFFALFSGDHLEYFLVLLAIVLVPPSLGMRSLLRKLPFTRGAMVKADAVRFQQLKRIHGDAYQLLLLIAGRFISNLIKGALVSLALIVLYTVADSMSLSILDDRRVTALAFLAVFGAPLLGIAFAILWTGRLVADLKDYDESLRALEKDRRIA